MSEKFSECCTCGFKWITGKSGDHSCSRQLKSQLDAVSRQLNEALAKIELFKKHDAIEAEAACEEYINGLGGAESNARHDAAVDGVFIDAFILGKKAGLSFPPSI